jgi:hypothetical protein
MSYKIDRMFGKRTTGANLYWQLALTPGIKQKATSVRLSNPSYGLLESGKVGRQKKCLEKENCET